MDEKRYGWEAYARRTILSPKRELETLPGFWVRARKYSVASADELRAVQRTKRGPVPPAVRSILSRAIREEREFGDVIRELEPAEAEAIIAEMPSDVSTMADIMALSILHGIGEHNLGEEEASVTMTREVVDRIMDYPDTAREVWKIVQEWNTPLPKATSKTSGTSPSGSSEGAPSSPERSSPTEEDPSELVEGWSPWVREAVLFMDSEGTVRHWKYPGAYAAQPEQDREIYEAARKRWVEMVNAERKKK